MSDRYTLTCTKEDISRRFEIEMPENFEPSYNAAPTHLLPVITNTGRGGLSYFYWGLMPEWAKKQSISKKLINVETDMIKEKASYYRAFKNRRCIIPADGFYAWKQVSKKGVVPHRITLKDQPLFSFAGLWEEFEDEEGTSVHTFTLITTPSSSSLEQISKKMPAILNTETEKIWLSEEMEDEDKLISILQPYTDSEIEFYTVSPRINSVKINSPELIQPAPAADQFGNYSLFD